MIHQIAAVPQKTTRLGLACRDLSEAHDLQVRVRNRAHVAAKPHSGLVTHPVTGQSSAVPVLAWFD